MKQLLFRNAGSGRGLSRTSSRIESDNLLHNGIQFDKQKNATRILSSSEKRKHHDPERTL